MRSVTWLQFVLSELTDLWLQSSPEIRKQITKACHEIDKQLVHDPESFGESRDEGRRIAFEPPLAIMFRIEADGQAVTVLDVRLMRKRRP